MGDFEKRDINEALRQQPAPLNSAERLYTQAEFDAAVAEAIDRDRITGFMAFTANLDPNKVTLVYGTSQHAQSIRRALMKAGYA